MDAHPVVFKGDQAAEEPAIEKVPPSLGLSSRFMSWVPYSKQFTKRIEEKQKHFYDRRWNSYNKLSSIDSRTKENLAAKFKTSAQGLSQIDSWIETAVFWAKSLALTITIILVAIAPPLLSTIFPQLVASSFQGFWGSLFLSLTVSWLALLTVCLPFILSATTSTSVDEFFRLERIVTLWMTTLLIVAIGYVFGLYAGRFDAWPPYFRYRVVFYFVIQAGFFAPVFLVFALPVRALVGALERRKRALATRLVIIDHLLLILTHMERPNYKDVSWPLFSARTDLTKHLETIASCIEKYFPLHFVTGTPEMDRWTARSALELANGVREMTKAVITPTTYTLQDLQDRIKACFAAAIVSEWGRFARVPADKLTRKQSVKARAAAAGTANRWSACSAAFVA